MEKSIMKEGKKGIMGLEASDYKGMFVLGGLRLLHKGDRDIGNSESDNGKEEGGEKKKTKVSVWGIETKLKQSLT